MFWFQYKPNLLEHLLRMRSVTLVTKDLTKPFKYNSPKGDC